MSSSNSSTSLERELLLPDGLVGAWWRSEYQRPHERFRVLTYDGIALRGIHFRTGRDTLIIYSHGFMGHKNYTLIPRFVEGLADAADVIAFDFRGHGESEGESTLSEREVMDLNAVMNYARDCHYRRILLVGSSMGGAVSLRYAAKNRDVAGVATIGAFANSQFSFLAMQGLNLFRLPFTRPFIRLASNARIDSVEFTLAPLDVIRQISPRPVLLVHGELDPLIPLSHAHALYAAAGDPKQLIIVPNGGHDIPTLDPRTGEWIVEWARKVASE